MLRHVVGRYLRVSGIKPDIDLETWQDVLTRRIVLASIWSIVLLLGLPWWIWTTRIHRAPLPMDRIETLKLPEAVGLEFPLNFILYTPKESPMIQLVQNHLDKWNQNVANTKDTLPIQISFKSTVSWQQQKYKGDPRLIEDEMNPEMSTYHIHLIQSDEFKVYVGNRRILGIYLPQDSDTQNARLIGQVLDSIFLQERKHLITQLDDSIRNKEKLRTVKFSSKYQITLSMMVGDSDRTCSWDIVSTSEKLLEPFLQKFRPFVNLKLDSQMQFAASLNVQPRRNNNSFILRPDQLPTFINSAEWNLANLDASSIPLNFVLYVPSQSQSPLYILDSKNQPLATNAFLIPRWGGIVIGNKPDCQFSQQDLREFAQIVVEQARKLLGVQTVKPSMLHFVSTSPVGLTDWELDRWIRKRTAENVVNSARTLTSLGKLITNMNNMVVMDEIRNQVEGSLNALDDTKSSLQQGNLTQSFIASKNAVDLAETAFFHPTMVSMLYFPSEHRFAIYMPLFVPATVPLLTATYREWLEWKKSRKTKSD